MLLTDENEIVERKLSDLGDRVCKLEANTQVLRNKTTFIFRALEAEIAMIEMRDILGQFSLDSEVLTDAILSEAKWIVHSRMMPPETIRDAARTIANSVTRAKFPQPEKKFLIYCFAI